MILPMLEGVRHSLDAVSSVSVVEGRMYELVRELYVGMGEKYRKMVDSVFEEAFEGLVEVAECG